MKIILFFLFLSYLIIGGYFGVGSIVRVNLEERLLKIEEKRDEYRKDTTTNIDGNNTFKDGYTFRQHLALKDLDLYPWAKHINELLAVIIAACSFSLLGSLISLLKSFVIDKIGIGITSYIKPILATLMGVVVVALVYLLPSVLVKGEGDIKPYPLMFFALLTGMFTEDFYNYIYETFIKKILKNEK